MKKKSIITCGLLLLLLTNAFSANYSRKQTVKFTGSDDFYVWAVGSLVFVPITWVELHEFDWTVSLSASGNNKLCYLNSETKDLYVKKDTNVTISTSVSGNYDEQIESFLYVNGKKTSSKSFTVSSPIKIEYKMEGPQSDNPSTQIVINIYPDNEIPIIKIDNKVTDNNYFNKNIMYLVEDISSDICVCNINNEASKYTKELLNEGSYTIFVEDLVGNTNTKTVFIDKTAPVIKAYTDETCKKEFVSSGWSNDTLYIKYEDSGVGIKTKTEKSIYNTSGEYNLYAIDKAGNRSDKIIKIDNTVPTFDCDIRYSSEYDTNSQNYKSKFVLTIKNMKELHSGIKEILVIPFKNEVEQEPVILSNLNKNDYIDYVYEISGADRNIDNILSFKVQIKDNAGNEKSKILGDKKGFFIPAVITIDYSELEKNKVKVNFYGGNKHRKCIPSNYSEIKINRKFFLKNQNGENDIEINEKSFSSSEESKYFHNSQKDEWEKLKENTEQLDIITTDVESYYIDKKIEGSGFTHKIVLYECVYKYKNPIDENSLVEEGFLSSEYLNLSNNRASYFLKVKGDNETYLVVDSEGKVIEGNSDSFEMSEFGVVGLELKVEDVDVEPCIVEIQGKVEVKSDNNSFKLQKIDSMPIGVIGCIAGCKNVFVDENNRSLLIPEDREMTGKWIDLGEYSFQYNITNVFEIEITEGFSGYQESWTSEAIHLYAELPNILGGKGRLIVGDASSNNSEGITARPWQKLKMEIIPADDNQQIDNLKWDFGNGKTSDNYGDYKKISNTKYEEIYYEQNPNRMGAVSEYTLKICLENETAEFKVNIIDTQYGFLLGNEIWRGEHIIRGEVIVPNGITLQIGDTSKDEYETDIKCLCIGKIIEEEKAGITIEDEGCLVVNEGHNRRIEFVQGILETDTYKEAAPENKTLDNMWKGIKVKGILEGDSLRLCDAEQGIEIYSSGEILFQNGDGIYIERCKNGILMNGKEFKANCVNINNSLGYGIKVNTNIVCEKLKIEKINKQGIILTESAELNSEEIMINDCVVGIHLLGGTLKVLSGKISNCSEYGVKIDQFGLYDNENILLENNVRNIYEKGITK